MASASPAVCEALRLYNAALPAPEAVTVDYAFQAKQKQLAHKADSAAWEAQLASAPLWARAVLRSEAEPGARAFLAAVPHLHKRMEPAVFVTELRHRLLVPEAAADTWCPKCDGILDRHSGRN